MIKASSARSGASLNSFARTAGAVVALTGFASLVGWMLDIAWLKSPSPGLVTMKANIALALLAAGGSLCLLREERASRRARRLGQVCAAFAALVGVLTLAEYLLGWNLGIDQWLIPEPPGAAGTSNLGRMAPTSALNFVLVGLALLSLDLRRAYWAVESLALVPMLISLTAAVGYLYSLQLFYRPSAFTGMGFYTAVAFIVLCPGILCARPDRGLIGVLAGDQAGAVMARRLLPATVLIPILFASLRWEGQRLRLYSEVSGWALFTLANIVVFNAFVWWNARSLSQLDRQRRMSEEQLRAVVETANDAIVSADSQGRIIYVNRSAASNFGYSAAELVGQPLTVLMPERFRKAHLEGLQRFRSTGKARVIGNTVELVALRRDGSEFLIEISLGCWSTGGGEGATGFTGVLRDITNRRQTEESLTQKTAELARSNRELEQFAYAASHDLQEPLRMVTSYVQLLERRYKGQIDATADEFIQYAVDGARRMRALINDLLAYSRVGRRARAWQPVSCDSLVERALANLQVAIEESGAVVRHEPLPTVRADDGELVQLFQNLIGNAIKFRKPQEQPEVLVAAERQDGEWQFSVSDNGIGIDAQFADRIFVIFQRLHSRQEYPGTGIGLAICKKIVENLRGRIWVDSRPNEGARFTFTIPDGEGESS